MGLVVSLGLERFHDNEREQARVGCLEDLVKGGYTTLVREVFFDPEALEAIRNQPEQQVAAKSKSKSKTRTPAKVKPAPTIARVVEVSKRGTRWLGDKDAAPIVEDLASFYQRRNTYDAYSWDELEDLGADNIQDLALELDGKTSPPGLVRVRVGKHDLRLIDLDTSLGNWSPDSIAFQLHELAMQHRLIVHSA